MLQGQRDLAMVGRLVLSELAPLVNAQLGAIYQLERNAKPRASSSCQSMPTTAAGYPDYVPIGKGLIGQCAASKRRIFLSKLPAAPCPSDPAVFKALRGT